MQLDNLFIQSFNIQRIYDDYSLNNKFLVNRKYQRKLVWTMEEKQAFIDSISKKYPVPLFLVASKQNIYEIIDGMQRLNAIFSFIEGEFGVVQNGVERFFDLETMPTTSELIKGEKIVQRLPKLDYTTCREIANYELPFSVASFDSEAKIEEIFRRINSNGRHLSDHEIRQAGALGKFSDLVRILSAEIRRDSSPSDVLNLNRMKEISLSNTRLPYGINLQEVFWVEQGIIELKNMRVSRDEELIAYILTYMILGRSVDPSARNLDNIYKYNIEETNIQHLSFTVEEAIDKIGAENIQKRFIRVFEEIEILLSHESGKFCDLLFNNTPFGKVRTFQVIFLAFYNLIINENSKIANYNGLLKSLKGIADRMLSNINSDQWGGKFRDEKIKAVQGVLTEYFEKNDGIDDPAFDNWVIQFENLLTQSKIEQQQFDFKIGFHRLDATASFVQSTFNKVVKTLTAMANLKPKSKGYVIIGVADNEVDSLIFQALYSGSVKKYGNYNITGIDKEAIKNYQTIDAYYSRIRDLIKNEPIEEYTKDYILRNMKMINYFGKSILVLQIESSLNPLLYDNKFYVRKASSVEEILPAGYADLFARFSKSN